MNLAITSQNIMTGDADVRRGDLGNRELTLGNGKWNVELEQGHKNSKIDIKSRLNIDR